MAAEIDFEGRRAGNQPLRRNSGDLDGGHANYVAGVTDGVNRS
jgi:hypothetical protein